MFCASMTRHVLVCLLPLLAGKAIDGISRFVQAWLSCPSGELQCATLDRSTAEAAEQIDVSGLSFVSDFEKVGCCLHTVLSNQRTQRKWLTLCASTQLL